LSAYGNVLKEKRQINRNSSKPIQKYRFLVQSLFSLLCIWIGIEFYFFISFLESNGTAGSSFRPPDVEGFLPISALMSVFYFFQTGEIHNVHPAGFFIFLAIIGVSFLFGKSFCRWLCPIGFLSELVGDFGEKVSKKLFKRKIKLPILFDYPLRSLKYLLLAFFAFAIFSMSVPALNIFLSGDYNISADIKMWYFFANISRTALIVIFILFVLSIIIRNFWCRYLCPYGVLWGLIGFLSPAKTKRNPASCINCELCSKACPSFIKVDKLLTVHSDECTSCLNCIDVCPVENTLDVKNIFTKKTINKKYIALGIILIFISITGFGILIGKWQNNVPVETYLKIHKNIESIGHPTSTSEIEEFNKESAKEQKNERHHSEQK
jgi:polyferredoxin